jgi:hypothetical protein
VAYNEKYLQELEMRERCQGRLRNKLGFIAGLGGGAVVALAVVALTGMFAKADASEEAPYCPPAQSGAASAGADGLPPAAALDASANGQVAATTSVGVNGGSGGGGGNGGGGTGGGGGGGNDGGGSGGGGNGGGGGGNGGGGGTGGGGGDNPFLDVNVGGGSGGIGLDGFADTTGLDGVLGNAIPGAENPLGGLVIDAEGNLNPDGSDPLDAGAGVNQDGTEVAGVDDDDLLDGGPLGDLLDDLLP